MILGLNFKTFLAYAMAIGLALILPTVVAVPLGVIAGIYAFMRMIRGPGAPNGLPLHRKPAVWLDSAKRFGLLSVVYTYTATLSFILMQAAELAPRSSELFSAIIIVMFSVLLAFFGMMMSNTVKGAADYAQQEADEAAARGEGPKCTCTRKCGLC